MSDYKKSENSLAVKMPELARQWHPSKNEGLTPNDVTPGSGKKAWWQCEKGHEYQSRIDHRANGVGCPICSNKQVLAGFNDLATRESELARQWHPSKNEGLTPSDVTPGSGKKAWWQCEKGHGYQSSIADRVNGVGCPFCANKKVLIGFNDLASNNADLAKEWHPSLNGELTPNDVTPKSGKKVWWKCEVGHEYQSSIANRANRTGCPFCANKQVLAGFNDLATKDAELAKEWHPLKNGDMTPNEVTSNSGKRVWWLCEKGHEWESSVDSRSSKSRNCPYCSGSRASAENNLQILNPELAKEWHPTKNGMLTPDNVMRGSGRKVWWICRKGHEWEAFIANRSKGIGCPECSKESQTSFPEQAIYFYIKSIFSDTLNRYKYDGKWEVDIFVPSLNFGIEYDGIYFHDENKASDIKKEKYLVKNGITLLRVKEIRSQKKECYLEDNVICLNARFANQLLNQAIELCISYISENITHRSYNISVDVEYDRSKIYELYLQNEKENSFLSLYPE